MQPWSNRPVEEANLFNPAFCATVLATAVHEYARKANKPLPYALIFLVLPIVLHQATREALPHSTITSLLPWIQANRDRLVNFAQRVCRLRPISREALLFGIQHSTLAIDSDGSVVIGSKRQAPTEKRTELYTAEVRDCIDRAGFIGRWFAAAGTIATIYAAWGISP